ncbi:FAD binding domain-containing protein [Seiridium cupressi]
MSFAASQAAVKNLEEVGLSEVLYRTARKPDSYGERVDRTVELSKALVALVKADACELAVRRLQQHRDGVTIDLRLMNVTEYNPETDLLSCRWTNISTYSEEQGVMVAGGREGLVGIGGLLTGGGKMYYTCRVGLACALTSLRRTSLNYEVVLADGTITNASESANQGLIPVLKGGSNNFGIVTRFDMRTFPTHDIYDGIVAFAPSSTDAVIDAFVDFTKQLHIVQDAHILAMWVSMSKRDISLLNGIVPDPTQPPDLTMVSMINMIMTQLDGVEKSPSLEKCGQLSDIFEQRASLFESGLFYFSSAFDMTHFLVQGYMVYPDVQVG